MDTPSSQFGDQWSLAEGTWHNGLPIIMRIRLEIDEFVGSPEYSVGYRITWKFENPTTHGYPSDTDNDLLTQFEVKLLNAFEPNGTAIVAAVVTHNGERDFVCYTSDPNSAHSIFNETFASEPVKPLSFAASPDPEWQEYLGMRTQIVPE